MVTCPKNLEEDTGFSLLELLVAMAVLSVALIPMVGSQSDTAARLAAISDATYARYVAENQLVLVRSQVNDPAAGTRQGTATQAGLTYDWVMTVRRLPGSSLMVVDVTVSRNNKPLYSLTGFRKGY